MIKYRTLVIAAILVATPELVAQSFSIGPGISNYSTEVKSIASTDTGRQVAFGLAGDYRSGAFVLDYLWDHDPENGISITDILVDTGNYSRNRGEVTVGFNLGNFLDLQGGLRLDSYRIGGASFLGTSVASELDIEHQAIVAGIRVHTDERQPVAFYALGRGLLGNAKLDFGNVVGDNESTTGFRVEAGIPIRLGQSNWRIVPGVELEHLETQDDNIEIDTNRVFVNFLFRR